MPTPIAVDAGHGFTKALAASGTQTIFRSLIGPAPTSVDLGEYAQAKAVEIDGAPYLVGDAARKHAAPLWSRDKAADPDTLRLILVAAAQVAAVGPVQLATGLPLAWYGSQRRAFREALAGFGATVRLPGRPSQRLWIENVRVLPQGVAAAATILARPAYEPGEYLVCDVGYRTTDYIVVRKAADGTLDYEPSAAASLEVGMHSVAHRLAQELSHRYQVDFSPTEIEGHPDVVVRGCKVDLSERLHAARQVVGRQMARSLAAALGSEADKLLGLIAVGGGADVLATAIPGVIVPPDAQWANAQGYLLAAIS